MHVSQYLIIDHHPHTFMFTCQSFCYNFLKLENQSVIAQTMHNCDIPINLIYCAALIVNSKFQYQSYVFVSV